RTNRTLTTNILKPPPRASTRTPPPPLPAPRDDRPHLAARPPRPRRRRGLHLRHAPQPVLRPQRRVRAAPRLHPRRRHPPPRLEGLVQDRQVLHQTVRGRDEPALHPGRGRQQLHALRPPGAEQVRLRLHHPRP